MTREIICSKLKKKAMGMNSAPFPGPLGEKIYAQISVEAWKLWLEHQTMLINEYRLSLMDKKAREFLHEEMRKFFFEEGSQKPAGFKAKEE